MNLTFVSTKHNCEAYLCFLFALLSQHLLRETLPLWFIGIFAISETFRIRISISLFSVFPSHYRLQRAAVSHAHCIEYFSEIDAKEEFSVTRSEPWSKLDGKGSLDKLDAEKIIDAIILSWYIEIHFITLYSIIFQRISRICPPDL